MRWYKRTISCDQSLLQNNVVDNIISGDYTHKALWIHFVRVFYLNLKAMCKKQFITKLTFNNLILKIVQSLFIHRLVHFMHRYRALKTYLTHKYIKWYKVWPFMIIFYPLTHLSICQTCFQSMKHQGYKVGSILLRLIIVLSKKKKTILHGCVVWSFFKFLLQLAILLQF